jgi:membrane associated rhomboid family serine protease
MVCLEVRPKPHLIEIDVCRMCELVWFDSGEIMKLLPRTKSLPPTVRTRTPLPPPPPETVEMNMERVLKAIYLPFEVENDEVEEGGAKAAFILAAVMLLVFVPAVKNPWWWEVFAFQTHLPLRGVGLAAFSSLFIHYGLVHLLGNLYFLVLFGHDLEKRIGSMLFLEVFVLSGLAGCVLSSIFYLEPTRIGGASGGIAGVLCYYFLAFPKAKLHFSALMTSPHESGVVQFSFSAIGAITTFLAFNLVGAYAQVYWLPAIERSLATVPQNDLSFSFSLLACRVDSDCVYALSILKSALQQLREVAFLAHVGGAIGGCLLFGVWQMRSDSRKGGSTS